MCSSQGWGRGSVTITPATLNPCLRSHLHSTAGSIEQGTYYSAQVYHLLAYMSSNSILPVKGVYLIHDHECCVFLPLLLLDDLDISSFPAEIKVRGSSSAVDYVKKSFALKTLDQNKNLSEAKGEDVRLLGGFQTP